MPQPANSIELTQQLHQHRLPAGRVRGRGADPPRQGIRLGPLLLIRHLLRRRPVMYPDRLTRITSRCQPFTTMINCLSFTENPLLTRTNVQITADSFELLPDENWSRYAGFRSRRSRWNVR